MRHPRPPRQERPSGQRSAPEPPHAPRSPSRAGMLQVAVVGRPHGLAGELRVHPHNAHSSALETVRRVELVLPERQQVFEIAQARGAGKAVLLRLAGLAGRDAAELWRGASVWVFRDELDPLEPGEFYLVDVIGATVVGPSGEIGRVVDLALHPTVDCIVIERPDGQRSEQPLMEPWLQEVDVAAGIVRLTSEEGMID